MSELASVIPVRLRGRAGALASEVPGVTFCRLACSLAGSLIREPSFRHTDNGSTVWNGLPFIAGQGGFHAHRPYWYRHCHGPQALVRSAGTAAEIERCRKPMPNHPGTCWSHAADSFARTGLVRTVVDLPGRGSPPPLTKLRPTVNGYREQPVVKAASRAAVEAGPVGRSRDAPVGSR
jgi:hypothetical protein